MAKKYVLFTYCISALHMSALKNKIKKGMKRKEREKRIIYILFTQSLILIQSYGPFQSRLSGLNPIFLMFIEHRTLQKEQDRTSLKLATDVNCSL